jgi:acyl carrier protein
VPPNGSADVPPPLGTSIANTEIHLLDEQLSPVPSGSAGEIYIGGRGVARGYRNLPELTSEKFVPNPLSSGRTNRLYKTGDLARRLPDGRLVFLGRTDDQLKIRGYRIEPGEISLALSRHPDVRHSLVVAREDTLGDKRLVGYLVLDTNSGLTHSELRDFLRGFLPEYMLPAVFVRLDAWPLTSNGKIDRAALPTPTWENTLQDDTPVRPYTATEQRVAEILGELLGLEEIDLDDNFFLLGGHSLLGAQLMARLRAAFGVEIGLRSLFEAPTVTALACEVDRLAAKNHPLDTTSPASSAT